MLGLYGLLLKIYSSVFSFNGSDGYLNYTVKEDPLAPAAAPASAPVSPAAAPVEETAASTPNHVADVVSNVTQAAIETNEVPGFMSYLPTFDTVLTISCIAVAGAMLLYYMGAGNLIHIIEKEDGLQKQASALSEATEVLSEATEVLSGATDVLLLPSPGPQIPLPNSLPIIYTNIINPGGIFGLSEDLPLVPPDKQLAEHITKTLTNLLNSV
jgi:hypothetical protein